MNNQNSNKKKIKPKAPAFSFYWIYAMIAIGLAAFYLLGGSAGLTEITWQEFEKTMLRKHDVEKILVVNKEIVEVFIKKERLQDERHKEVSKETFGAEPNLGPHYYFTIGSVETFESSLKEAQMDFNEGDVVAVRYITRTDWWKSFSSWLIPLAIMVFLWLYILRRVGASSGAGSMFNFGKSTAVLFEKGSTSKVTFNDVAGLNEAKREIKEIVDFLKNPETFTKLGAKIPKGVMLIGAPGTGKTLLAKAVAGEAQVPFFSLSGSEFIEMFVGVGASRVRDLFDKAKEKAPSIIFIDEIDAIGRARGRVQSFQANDERESTLNQLLTEMDGFDPNTGVIVLAATNRADILDPALLRPGRFDRHIMLELPNLVERAAIFNVHMKPLKLSDDVESKLLASQTPGFSGADIANCCNEAALIAARRKKDQVDKQDFMDALDRIIGGLERKSTIISPGEKKVIAYHEAGHAVVSWKLKHVDPLIKVSIIPRGKSLGAAWYLPEEHHLKTKSQLLDQICSALGGRASEEIIFSEISSGALDDLEKVTKQAYLMVAQLGLNEQIGNISFYDSTGTQENAFHKPYSEDTAKLIDEEVRKLVESCYERTKSILIENKESLDALAQLLLEKEVVLKEDIEKLLGKRPLNN